MKQDDAYSTNCYYITYMFDRVLYRLGIIG